MSIGQWWEAFIAMFVMLGALSGVGLVLLALLRAAWRYWRAPKYQRHIGVAGDCWPVNKPWADNKSVRRIK